MSRAKLYAPDAYWRLSKLQRDLICNGCGAKGLGGWLVPDTLYGLSIEAACQIHDYMYHLGRDHADKQTADRAFLNNMLRIIEAESGALLRSLRRQRAMKYYTAVAECGGPAYWADKNKSSEMVAA